MVASSSTLQEQIVDEMLGHVSAVYNDAYNGIKQKIAETGTVVSELTELTLQKGGEVNAFLDEMGVRANTTQLLWEQFFAAVQLYAGETIDPNSTLLQFLAIVDSGTTKPKENWEIFKTAVGQEFATENFELFAKMVADGTAVPTSNWDDFVENLGDTETDIDTSSKSFLTSLELVNSKIKEMNTNWKAFVDDVAKDIKVGEIVTNKSSEGKTVEDPVKVAQNIVDAQKETLKNPPTNNTTNNTNNGSGNSNSTENSGSKSTGSTNGLLSLVSNVTAGSTTKAATSDSKKTNVSSLGATKLAIADFISGLPKPTTELKNKMSSYSELVQHVYKKDKKFLSEKNQLKLAGVLGFKDIAAKTTKTITAADKKKILKKLEDNGYASGTLGTKTNELNWTHQGEIIRRSDGAILRQLPAGTQVIPKVESENLIKWAKINPLQMFSDLQTPSVVQNQSSQSVTLNVESIFHIDGNVDADVMDRLEELGKALTGNRNFQKNITNIVTKEYVREGRKLGYK